MWFNANDDATDKTEQASTIWLDSNFRLYPSDYKENLYGYQPIMDEE